MAETERLIASASTPSGKRGPRTIVHEILDSQLGKHDKSFQRVFEEVTSVSGAGFETTGGVLRLLSYCVLSLVVQVHQEPGTIDLRKLELLPFLTAVVMEGLRLSPGVATRMARIAPDRDLCYRDWRIPAGTPVGMTTILMHTDERSYPNPYSFRPERWMDGSGGRKNVDHAYAPFSRGTRMCVGMQ